MAERLISGGFGSIAGVGAVGCVTLHSVRYPQDTPALKWSKDFDWQSNPGSGFYTQEQVADILEQFVKSFKSDHTVDELDLDLIADFINGKTPKY